MTAGSPAGHRHSDRLHTHSIPKWVVAVPDAVFRDQSVERRSSGALSALAGSDLICSTFGSDFTAEELTLLPALKRLQAVSASPPRMAAFLLRSLARGAAAPD